MIRRMVERLSREVSFKARLPQRFGRRPIYVSPGNQLSVLKPGDRKFEAYLLGFVDRFIRSGDVVWDIGANMGMFTLPAAHAVGRDGRVISFEPDPFNQLLLHQSRTAPANRDLNITVVPAAVSAAVDTATLEIPERGRSANSIAGGAASTQMGGVRYSYNVVTITLDWALQRFPAPNFVKCDAEGAEVWILQGAARLLAETRPVFIIEMPKENADACQSLLQDAGYLLFDAHVPVDPTRALSSISGVWEVLAAPSEQLERLRGR